MRRKYAQPALPTLSFKDGILSVPGYTFEKVRTLPRAISVLSESLTCRFCISARACPSVPARDK